jgi:hypothetical protein
MNKFDGHLMDNPEKRRAGSKIKYLVNARKRNNKKRYFILFF